jgi:CheY-like chemotaxis protein
MLEALRRAANGTANHYNEIRSGLAVVARVKRTLSDTLDLVTVPECSTTSMTTFTLAGPLAKETGARPKRTVGRGHVLIVDDNLDVAETLGEVLALHGFEATLAGSAKQAAQELDAAISEYHYLISDFRLPDRNGLEVAEMARRRFPSIKLIILTGDPLDCRLDAAQENGIKVLQKPIEIDELLAVFQK